MILSIIMAISGGYMLIPLLRRIKMGQYVREDGPQSHLQKAGTPTMGGFIFLLPFLVVGILTGNLGVLFWVTLACAGIGLTDDYIKVVLKRSLGLKAYQKLLLQFMVILVYVGYQYYQGQLSTQIVIPFVEGSWDMGGLWYPFIVIVVLGTINGSNLTDGLDGLSASVTAVIMLFLVVAAFLQGKLDIGILALLLLSGLLGFLWFNTYPAKVFMGDTGSLALGGFVAFVSIYLKLPLFILLFGIIYLAESISVMLQVAYFKKTGKRLFKMAPLHHHFELSGLKETKIVTGFTLITILGTLLALLALL
ncbi:phospho-N-acetylmuramoyl-pentapeptide-transferase [Clostridiales bacterium COT073_COT-073]|nr:phospho-N-acetylmuramoyl-pentapeptide-transferase [Clostridiales bacterium COT073_COT-073]